MKRRVILAGGGHAHLAVLADWARRPLADAECWLITSARHLAYSGMVPGWIAGFYRADELLIDLVPLAKAAGARLVLADVVGLDAGQRRLSLSTGEVLEFDLLSLATGGETDTSRLEGLGQRLLTVRPLDRFMQQWSRFIAAHPVAAPVHAVVAGGGAGGVELAFAVQSVLARRCDKSRVSLVSGKDGLLAGHADTVKRRVRTGLAARGIALHPADASAEVSGEPGGLILSDGTRLEAHCVIAATGSRAPRWIAPSGIVCTDAGFVAVGADLRSISHPALFAAGDIVERIDRPLPRSGVHAVKAGPVLAANLRAALRGAPLQRYQPRARTLYLLGTGDRRAILSWGGFSAEGQLAWNLKDRIDRRFVERYRLSVP